MTRGMFYKLLLIVALIGISILLILPTFGEKEMIVTLQQKDQSQQEQVVKRIMDRFTTGDQKGNYSVTVKDYTVTIKGINLTAGIMNEVVRYEGVQDAIIKPHWVEDVLKAKKINLGLDLQGGMHLIMAADFEELQRKNYTNLTIKEKAKLSREERDKKIKNLNSGEKLAITEQALERIRNRIDGSGVAEPSIRIKGNEAIEIQLPGVKNPEQVKEMLRKTGRVEYRLVDDKYTDIVQKWLINTWLPANTQGTDLPGDGKARLQLLSKYLPSKDSDREKLINEAITAINLPTDDYTILYHYTRSDKGENSEGELAADQMLVLENKVALQGDDIKTAWPTKDEYGNYKVSFQLHPNGSTKFAKVTVKENHGKRLAIIIDNKVRSMPAIRSQITGGNAEITGDFTQREVKTLAGIIKEGALPVSLRIIEERTVGPTLGQDAIESGQKAIMIGVLGILLFMLIYYKLGGLISGIGLILNMVFMLAILSLLGATLTLPGIAGFILTVGMAVDANVIIYERIKEELREGKSVRMAIRYGFDKAFWTIFDANLTTIIAAIILYSKGTGPIKGFAVMLLIGVISSMFVALYITRYVYELISLNKKLKKLSI